MASRLVQEEARLRSQGSHFVNLTEKGAGMKPKAKKFKKKKTLANAPGGGKEGTKG